VRTSATGPGYDADILAVDGNPLSDPAALHAIRAVYVRGGAGQGPSAPTPLGWPDEPINRRCLIR